MPDITQSHQINYQLYQNPRRFIRPSTAGGTDAVRVIKYIKINLINSTLALFRSIEDYTEIVISVTRKRHSS